jgi:HAMP domain-containing protein
MKYYYSLDSHSRINHITTTEISYYQTIELTEAQFKTIKLGETGVSNGALVQLGKIQEIIELEQIEIKTSRILELKQLLQDSDWKVIVNSELIQAGLPLKYPDLHQERQAWRDEINQLEGELESLGSSLEV